MSLCHPVLQILLARNLPGTPHATHCMDVAAFGTRTPSWENPARFQPQQQWNALSKTTPVRKPRQWDGFMPSPDAPARARRLWLYPHPGPRSSDRPCPAPTRPGCCRCCPVPRHPYGRLRLKAAPSLGSNHGRRNKEQTSPPQVPSLLSVLKGNKLKMISC